MKGAFYPFFSVRRAFLFQATIGSIGKDLIEMDRKLS